jgi:hypothetical protein
MLSVYIHIHTHCHSTQQPIAVPHILIQTKLHKVFILLLLILLLWYYSPIQGLNTSTKLHHWYIATSLVLQPLINRIFIGCSLLPNHITEGFLS